MVKEFILKKRSGAEMGEGRVVKVFEQLILEELRIGNDLARGAAQIASTQDIAAADQLLRHIVDGDLA